MGREGVQNLNSKPDQLLSTSWCFFCGCSMGHIVQSRRAPSIPHRLAPNPLTNAINGNDPFLACSQAGAPQMKLGTDVPQAAGSSTFPLHPQPDRLSLLPQGTGNGCAMPEAALLSGQWLPFDNETGNFLCPGNVLLVIPVILISRPQPKGWGRGGGPASSGPRGHRCEMFSSLFPLP